MLGNEQSPESFLLEVETRESRSNPNVKFVHRAVLSSGPRSMKVVKITEIRKGATGELHHRELRVESYSRKDGKWFLVDKRSVGLTDRSPDEITGLRTAIETLSPDALPSQSGDYRVVAKAQHEQLAMIAKSLPTLAPAARLEVLRAVVDGVARSPDVVELLPEVVGDENDSVFLDFAATVKLAAYTRALEKLRGLIADQSALEPAHQAILEAHPWMFGTEYSELLERRVWVRDQQADFMLRRTADGYLEILEIKLPRMKLFNYDPSHDARYPTADLSKVIGQTMKYLDGLDRQRDTIVAQDKRDPLKIRARIIAGVDTDEGDREALRNLNSHLHRVEVLTYSQLLRIAERVLGVFRSSGPATPSPIDSSASDDDCPF